MHWVDWAAIALIAALTVRGYRQGLIVELSTFVAIGLGLLGGLYLHEATMALLPANWPSMVQFAVGFALVFVVIALSVNLTARILRGLVHALFLGTVDKILGGVLGFLIGGQLLLIVVLLVSRYIPGGGAWLAHTRLPGAVFGLAEQILPLLPDGFSEYFAHIPRAVEELPKVLLSP